MGVNFGQFWLNSKINKKHVGNDCSISSENFKSCEFFQLERGERLFLISFGYLKSVETSIGKDKFLDVIDDCFSKSSEALRELFSRLKKII